MGKRLAGLALGLVLVSGGSVPVARQAIGIFTGSGDIGTPSTIGPGSAVYGADKNIYTLSGGGENMWAAADHFHYVSKKVSGDVRLYATIEYVGTRPATGSAKSWRPTSSWSQPRPTVCCSCSCSSPTIGDASGTSRSPRVDRKH